jgi:anti-sigma B factor antagonist
VTDDRTHDAVGHDAPQPVSTFALTVRPDERGDLLILSGELDLASAPLVVEAADLVGQTAAPDVIVDLSGLQFIDATGLSALIEVREHLAGKGRTMSLRGTPTCVHRVLKITGLTDGFLHEPLVRADGA